MLPQGTIPHCAVCVDTVVYTVAHKPQILPYATLMQHLDIPGLRELEDMLITECIYPGLVDARLDQQRQQLVVYHAYGRDVHPDKMAGLLVALDDWYGQQAFTQ